MHISFDIDGIDPEYAYGTGTKSRGGLNYREAMYICARAKETNSLVGFDMMEINPLLEKNNKRDIFYGDILSLK